jgi:hypothetical protein
MPSYWTLFILVSIIERFESEMILSFGDSLDIVGTVPYRVSLRDHMRA